MKHLCFSVAFAAGLFFTGVATAQSNKTIELSDAQMENLVRRSYQYVAMFNVNNKGALDESNPMSTRGYNKVRSATTLLDCLYPRPGALRDLVPTGRSQDRLNERQPDLSRNKPTG